MRFKKLIILFYLLAGTTSALAEMISWSSDGFIVNAGVIHTSADFSATPFGLIGYPAVKPTRVEQSMVYQYQGWTATLSPTEDAAGVHFEITFTNTSDKPADFPDFNLCTLAGNKEQFLWGSNLAGPLVLDQKLADGSHFAVTIDDPNSPMFAILIHTTQPFNGDCVIRFSTAGEGLSKQYDVPTLPTTVAAGASTTFKCSLRFGPDLASVSKDVCASWAKAFPYALKWKDHRQMLRGDLFMYDPTDQLPQGYIGRIDINDPANAQRFDDHAMNYARYAVATCKTVDAGAWIEWDLEGKQLEMNYKGNPHLIETLNPGWSHIDASGKKLIDRFFKTFQDAGIHVGVCLRPWTLRLKDGKLEVDETVSSIQSVMNHIDYCRQRWGLDIFYLDSPQFYQVPAYRKMMLDRPDVLLIPEDVPESWLQFSAPMVWEKLNVINWVSVPRNIYGEQGWGVYYQQNLQDPKTTERFLIDAKLGSTVLNDGWMGASYGPIRIATKLFGQIAKPATQPSNPLP